MHLDPARRFSESFPRRKPPPFQPPDQPAIPARSSAPPANPHPYPAEKSAWFGPNPPSSPDPESAAESNPPADRLHRAHEHRCDRSCGAILRRTAAIGETRHAERKLEPLKTQSPNTNLETTFNDGFSESDFVIRMPNFASPFGISVGFPRYLSLNRRRRFIAHSHPSAASNPIAAS